MEEWRDVIGYEGVYQVSDFANIKRIDSGKGVQTGRILKHRTTDEGYKQVKLCVNCVARVVFVHILVAEAFISKRVDGMQTNHKNGNPADNRPENLEWVTPSQNLQHAYDVLGRGAPRGENHGNAKLTTDDVREIRRLSATRKEYHGFENSYQDLADRFGVSKGLIGHIVNYRAWKHID